MKNTNIILRVEPELKHAAETLFSSMGLSMSSAISLFLTQSVQQQALPFSLTQPPLQVQEQSRSAYHSSSLISIIRAVQKTAKEYDIDRVVLFGSYISGQTDEMSDVDLYMESTLEGLDYFGVAEAFRTSTGKRVDLFSNKTIEPGSNIDREIKQTGVIIYQRIS